MWKRKARIEEADVWRAMAGIVPEGWVSAVAIDGGKVVVTITLPIEEKDKAQALQQDVESRIKALPPVENVMVVLTAERAANESVKKPAQWVQNALDDVAHVIAVASGKGGVGKSSMSVQLATALQSQGLRVGLLDADIYGPSLPRMLGVQDHELPEQRDGKILPVMAGDMPVMSMGALVKDGKAMIWRGSMVTKALTQMLRGTAWVAQGALDVLLIDMPPGTGDISLTLAQSVPLSGVVTVTTPQQVACDDADKSLQAFLKMDVPLLGVIENMSYIQLPDGTRMHPFGEGGAAALAEKYNVPLLAQVPLMPEMGAALDKGQVSDWWSEADMLAAPFADAAVQISEQLGEK